MATTETVRTSNEKLTVCLQMLFQEWILLRDRHFQVSLCVILLLISYLDANQLNCTHPQTRLFKGLSVLGISILMYLLI